MKKTRIRTRWWIVGITVVLGITTIFRGTTVAASKAQYKSAFLMDVETGQVLFQENAHKKVIPASVVKMMVLLLALEKIDAGELQLSDMVTVSAWASRIGGQQVYLAEGEFFPLVDLLKAIAISSANDAATAVAEYIAGDSDVFVDMMNRRAQELGMEHTTFANEHGLPPAKGQNENYTTAHDMALLGRELLKHPQILAWTSTIEDTFRNGTFTLTNTNRDLLRRYQGLDGLKTGFHSRGAGFNVCATAKRQDSRLIAVVMGAPTKADRYRAAVNLFNRGFNQFERVVVFRKGFTVGEPVLISRGKDRTTTLVASENAVVFVEKGTKQEITQEINIPVERIIAPIEGGTRFGEAVILIGEEVVNRVDLVTEKDIKKGSLVDRLKWWIVDKIS